MKEVNFLGVKKHTYKVFKYKLTFGFDFGKCHMEKVKILGRVFNKPYVAKSFPWEGKGFHMVYYSRASTRRYYFSFTYIK